MDYNMSELKTILIKLEDLKEFMEFRFDKADEHFAKLNGQTLLNSEHRIKQVTHNKWIKGILVLIIIPLGFLLLRSFL